MDIQRKRGTHRRRWSKWLSVAIAVFAVVFVIGISRIEPASPRIDATGVWVGAVQSGKMVREVRGSGSLVPEATQWLSAPSSGTVERVFAEVGSRVAGDTVIVAMVNPGLRQSALDALTELEAARATAKVLSAKLEGELLDKEGVVAAAQADYREAQLRAEADRRLADEGLLPRLTQEISDVRANELADTVRLARLRLERAATAARAEIEAQQSRILQLEALHRHLQDSVEALQVVAGAEGVLQEIRVEQGQTVEAGAVLAQIVASDGFRAELKIPQVQSQDLEIGQQAVIDTGLGKVAGSVLHIDPNVRQGSVLVTVELDGELPRGARVDLAVQGSILIDETEETLFVERAALWDADQTIGVFRLNADGKSASRRTVSLGRSSAATIEVIAGLEAGDRVILSDTSQWDDFNRIRLD